MKCQIVYMSAAVCPMTTEELALLLSKARKKNALLGVTGMLLYHEGSFLQALEGEEDVVHELYQRIERDDRHCNCAILMRSFIDKPVFSGWSMGFVGPNFQRFRQLPGFSNFLAGHAPLADLRDKPTVAHRLLLSFRDGQWHQHSNVSPEFCRMRHAGNQLAGSPN